jgi:hypothetical protein
MPRHAKIPTISFKDRLRQHADNLLEIAGTMPVGHQRDELQRKAGQIEVAIHMDEWLNSRGLRPPT